MSILEGLPNQYRSSSNNRASTLGQNGRPSSPAPVRSMLDVGGPVAPRHGSIAGSGVGITNPVLRSGPGVRSMLDPNSPLPTRSVHSATTSPADAYLPSRGLNRTASDAASHPPAGRPRQGSDREMGGLSTHTNYQFDMASTVQGQSLPKRVTQGGKKQNTALSSMAAIIQGQELGPLPRGRDSGRHNSTAGILGAKSKSPSSRLNRRSQSPAGSLSNQNAFNPMPTPGKFVTDAGKVIDLSNAYRRLSDAALLKSGGQLSNLPGKSASYRSRLGSGETLSPTGEIRMQKDYYEDDENGGAAIESSDEENSSEDDGWGSSSLRGRRRNRRGKGAGGGDADTEDSENDATLRSKATGTVGMGRAGGPRMMHSLLQAAEEERECSPVMSDRYRMT